MDDLQTLKVDQGSLSSLRQLQRAFPNSLLPLCCPVALQSSQLKTEERMYYRVSPDGRLQGLPHCDALPKLGPVGP